MTGTNYHVWAHHDLADRPYYGLVYLEYSECFGEGTNPPLFVLPFPPLRLV